MGMEDGKNFKMLLSNIIWIRLMGGKLNEKSIDEIRIFSNVFLRTMADNLSCES